MSGEAQILTWAATDSPHRSNIPLLQCSLWDHAAAALMALTRAGMDRGQGRLCKTKPISSGRNLC